VETFHEELRRHAAGIEWPGLHRFLDSDEGRQFFGQFQAADARANRLRRSHRSITKWSAIFGTLALTLGLIQLTVPHSSEKVALWIVEGALAFFAALLVIIGLLGHFHKNWLHARTVAERLRLRFFAVIADSRFWSTGTPPRDWDKRPGEEPEAWAKGGSIPEISRPGPAADGPAPVPVARFYLRARIETQVLYFENKEKSERRRFWDDPGLVQLIFFLSVVLALMHVLAHWARTRVPAEPIFETTSLALLFASALFPIMFTGFRTWRSANEFARNADRAVAKRAVLEKYRKSLEASEDSWALFTAMHLAESLLEEEQREWLRLMLEAEWI
jgi:hypothetical protein